MSAGLVPKSGPDRRGASDADHRTFEGAAEACGLRPVERLQRGLQEKGARPQNAMAPPSFAATPHVRQGHGPPGHGDGGSRAVRVFASHRRLGWDGRGGGVRFQGSRPSHGGLGIEAGPPKIDEGGQTYEARSAAHLPPQLPCLRVKRSHDKKSPAWNTRRCRTGMDLDERPLQSWI
ncbi:hypothetical protein CCMA1212_002523 [Trichoderma ghanense]|uniref:Uncharacterized protein n=1 Tax=Trichoderma ghanense TaxID=65468 RepID=A0ABY2HDC9_9HYPO